MLNHLTLIFFFLSIQISFGQSQAPGILDGPFISERHHAFIDLLEYGDEVWDDLLRKKNKKELVLTEAQKEIFEKRRHYSGFYPYEFGMDYNPLFYEDDHWSTRVYKTVNLSTSYNGVFGPKGPIRLHYIREKGKILTDTLYNDRGNTIFLERIEEAIRKEWITTYTDVWYGQILDDSYHPDSIAVDSIAALVKTANKMLIKEDYFYIKQTGKVESMIVAVGLYKDDQKLLWMYYPELSYSLRADFLFFDDELYMQSSTNVDRILREQRYEVESLRYETHKIHGYRWYLRDGDGEQTEYMTEMNALFQMDFIQTTIRANYRNYTGSIEREIHNDLILKARLENGQLQGLCELVTAENNPSVQIEFKNNIANGEYSEFYKNGKLKEKGRFELGLKEGEWLNYFESGKKMAERNYERGWMQGKQQFWFENRKPFMTFSYDNFELNGPFERYTEKGDLMESGFFSDNYPDGTWEVNMTLPQFYLDIFHANENLAWPYPTEAYKDGVLTFKVELEQGPQEKNCPSPMFKCVSLKNDLIVE